MFQGDWQLTHLAVARQKDLYEASSPYHVGSTTPSLLARARRNAGLALIAAGERLADRRGGLSVAGKSVSGGTSQIRTGHAA